MDWGDNIDDIGWNTQWTEDKSNDTLDTFALEQKALLRRIENDDIAFSRVANLSSLCKIPNENQQYRIITEKMFNAYAFIKYILQEFEIDEIYIAIYRINQPTAESIIEMIEKGTITKCTFILSNFFLGTTKSEKWIHIIKDYAEQNKNCRAAFVHNHSKVCLVKTKCNKHFILEGSGNMSDNARIEQYVLEQNKQVYAFHKEWMEEVYRKYSSSKNIS